MIHWISFPTVILNKFNFLVLEAKEAEKSKQRRQIQALSFNLDEDQEEDIEDDGGESSNSSFGKKHKWIDETAEPSKKIKKNPDVDTSFLPGN